MDFEFFIIVAEGGPHPGNNLVDERAYQWPLPGFINDSGGRYHKVEEGQYTLASVLVRGALYRWVPDGAVPDTTIRKVG